MLHIKYIVNCENSEFIQQISLRLLCRHASATDKVSDKRSLSDAVERVYRNTCTDILHYMFIVF